MDGGGDVCVVFFYVCGGVWICGVGDVCVVYVVVEVYFVIVVWGCGEVCDVGVCEDIGGGVCGDVVVGMCVVLVGFG